MTTTITPQNAILTMAVEIERLEKELQASIEGEEQGIKEIFRLRNALNTVTAHNVQFRKQAEHIDELESAIRNMAKHLEAIQHITERDNMSEYATAKAIRQHCEAMNILESIDMKA